MPYKLIFDEIILKQLKMAARNKHIESILTKLLDKIETNGPDAGKLLDLKLHLYEMKIIRPPIRLYFKHNIITEEIYIFEFEMKKSKNKQNDTINRIRKKISET